MSADIVIGVIAGTVVALLWNRPEIRPGRLLLTALALATGLSSGAWTAVLIGAVLLLFSVRPGGHV